MEPLQYTGNYQLLVFYIMSNIKKLQVRLETIKYGAWDNLEVAIDINEKPSKEGRKLYVLFRTIETILNYHPNQARKKIESKALKALLGENSKLGKMKAVIVNKDGSYKNTGSRSGLVSVILLQGFSQLITWEVSQGNTKALKLLMASFEDSFRSLLSSKWASA